MVPLRCLIFCRTESNGDLFFFPDLLKQKLESLRVLHNDLLLLLNEGEGGPSQAAAGGGGGGGLAHSASKDSDWPVPLAAASSKATSTDLNPSNMDSPLLVIVDKNTLQACFFLCN